MVTLHGRLSQTGSLQGTLSGEETLTCELTAGSMPRYNGVTTITPSDRQQVIHCADLVMSQDVVVNAIPSYYGKIAWNGVSLSVS